MRFMLELMSSNEEFFYFYLNELLFVYGSEYFVPRRIKIVMFAPDGGFLTAVLNGEKFDLSKHTQGGHLTLSRLTHKVIAQFTVFRNRGEGNHVSWTSGCYSKPRTP